MVDDDTKTTTISDQEMQLNQPNLQEFDCRMIPDRISNEKKTKVIVIMGAPGSGKDSVVQEIMTNDQRAAKYYHLSTGNIFRQEIRKQTPLGMRLEQCIRQGVFPPDNLVTAIVFTILNEQIDRIVLLNGYPRTPRQASQLFRFANVDKFILIDTPESICRQRIADRYIDPETGDVYTGAKSANLTRRPDDDDPHSLNQRFSFFRSVQPTIISHFRSVRHVVDGSRPLRYVVNKVIGYFDQPDLVDNPYCKNCPFGNVSSQMHVQCGHIVNCVRCAPTPRQDTSTSFCKECGETIIRNISLEIRKQMMETDNSVGNDKYVVSAQLCDDTSPQDETMDVCFSVQTETTQKYFPCHVCCVVDTSGSMDTKAVYEDIDGQQKSSGEGTVLDIAKLSVKTIIDLMTPGDTFSLVKFDTNAQILFSAQLMTPENKLLAKAQVDEMRAGGTTHMVNGIAKGIEAMRQLYGRKSIFFLTDGEPSDKDVQQRLEQYRDSLNNGSSMSMTTSMPRIHPIGFGVSLERGLLPAIAKIGNGMYAFVPDSGSLGSTLVRMIGNLRNEEAINPVLKLTLMNGAEFDGPVKNFMKDTVTVDSQTKLINLSSLQCGQIRDAVVRLYLPQDKFSDKSMPYIRAELMIENRTQLALECTTRRTQPHAKLAFLRTEMVYGLNNSLNCTLDHDNKTPDIEIIKKLIELLEQREACHDHVRLIINDLKGRIIKGHIPEKYKVWGYHYIAAFVRSHELQLCTSPLDASPGIYSNILLQAYLTYGKTRYTSPENAPVYTARQITATQYALPVQSQSQSQSRSQSQSQSQQNSSLGWGSGGGGGGSCFGGSCTVETSNGTLMRMRDIVPGDCLKVSDGYAIVKYMVKIAHRSEVLLFDNGLAITPTHPIKINGEWTKPYKAPGIIGTQKVDYVYNLVLDRSHQLLVNGVRSITWGHDSTDRQLYHPFYGSSSKIENCLKGLMIHDHGMNHGRFIQIEEFIRDSDDHVIGFR
jgi:adenylate kinase